MRSRNIKPGFFKNENLAECSPLARLLFAGLWCLADREGRLEDRPKRIKAEILSYDNCDIEMLLDELTGGGFIERYECQGVKAIQINAFRKHQHPHHRELASVLPGKDESESGQPQSSPRPALGQTQSSPEPARLIPDSLNLIPDSLNTSPRLAQGSSKSEQISFDQFWEAFPPGRKQGKEAARKAWQTAIKRAAPETIIEAAKEYAASPVGQGEFVKGPAPWLNQGCWEDDRTAWNRIDTSSRVNGTPTNGQLKKPRCLTDEEIRTGTYNPLTGFTPARAQ